MRLIHLGVDEEAGVTKLGDLLGQQLHSLHRVAEYDALVDLELREKRVEAVDFLALLHVGVVLGHTFQSQLVHQVDGVGRPQVALLLCERGVH